MKATAKMETVNYWGQVLSVESVQLQSIQTKSSQDFSNNNGNVICNNCIFLSKFSSPYLIPDFLCNVKLCNKSLNDCDARIYFHQSM